MSSHKKPLPSHLYASSSKNSPLRRLVFGPPDADSPSVTEDLAGWMRSLRNRGRSALARDEQMNDQLEEEMRLHKEQMEREKKEAEETGGSGAFDFLGRILDRYRKGSAQPSESDSEEEEVDQSYLQEKAEGKGELEGWSEEDAKEEEEGEESVYYEVADTTTMPDQDDGVVELLSSDEESAPLTQQNGHKASSPQAVDHHESDEEGLDEEGLFDEEDYDENEILEEDEEEEMYDDEMDDYYDEEDRNEGYGRYPEEDYELIDDGEEVEEEHPSDWNEFHHDYANLAHETVQELNHDKIHEPEENSDNVEPVAEATNFAMFVSHVPSQVDNDVAQHMIQDMNSFHDSQEMAIDSQLFSHDRTSPEHTNGKAEEYKTGSEVVDLEDGAEKNDDNSEQKKEEESSHNEEKKEPTGKEGPSNSGNKSTSTTTTSVQQRRDISKLVNRNLPEPTPLQSLRDINPFYSAEDTATTLSRYQEMTKAANERLGNLTMNFSFGSSGSGNKRKRDVEEENEEEQERMGSKEQPRPKSARIFQPKIHTSGSLQPDLENRLPSPVNFIGFSDRALGSVKGPSKQEVEKSSSKGSNENNEPAENMEDHDELREATDSVTKAVTAEQPPALVEETPNSEHGVEVSDASKQQSNKEKQELPVEIDNDGTEENKKVDESREPVQFTLEEQMKSRSVITEESAKNSSAETQFVQEGVEGERNVNESAHNEEMEVDNTEESTEIFAKQEQREQDLDEENYVDETTFQGEIAVDKVVKSHADGSVEDEKFAVEPVVSVDGENASGKVNELHNEEDKKSQAKAKSTEEGEREKENANNNEEDDLNLLSPQKPKRATRGRKPKADNPDSTIASRVLRSRSKKSDPEPEQPAEASPPKKRVTRSMAKESDEPKESEQSTSKSRKSTTGKRGSKRKVNLNKR